MLTECILYMLEQTLTCLLTCSLKLCSAAMWWASLPICVKAVKWQPKIALLPDRKQQKKQSVVSSPSTVATATTTISISSSSSTKSSTCFVQICFSIYCLNIYEKPRERILSIENVSKRSQQSFVKKIHRSNIRENCAIPVRCGVVVALFWYYLQCKCHTACKLARSQWCDICSVLFCSMH